jgi:hypothetical protein
MDERTRLYGEQADDTISLRPHVDTLWRYRLIIAAALGVAALAFVAIALFLIVSAPTERVASIQFRLMFTGAAQGRYPNDTPFSPMEIVGTPVLTDVFRANDLQRFGKYEDFKESVFVQRSSPELDLLSYEYQGRLADSKLSAVDRAKLEEEYRTKRESLTDPSFSLSMRRTARLTKLPRDLAEKVLTDILTTWAQQAELRKGAVRYDVPILSSRVLSRDAIQGLDYLIAADVLRAQASRIIRAIDQLAHVPGAQMVRTAPDDTSLPEVRAKLEDVVKFEIGPLMGTIRSEGITKNPRLLLMYASNMVFQLQLDKAEAESRAHALQSALAQYVSQNAQRATGNGQGDAVTGRPTSSAAVVPQLSESFLDRLEKMTVQSQEGEMEYRRKLTDQALLETKQAATYDKELSYYRELERALQGMGTRGAGSSELIAVVSSRTLKAFDIVEKATNQAVAIYKELSAQNLNPASRLFIITSPYAEHSRPAVSIGRLIVLFAFVLVLTVILAAVGALAHNAVRSAHAGGPASSAVRL